MNKTEKESRNPETEINNAIISSRLFASHNISQKEMDFCISFFDPIYPERSKGYQFSCNTSETA